MTTSVENAALPLKDRIEMIRRRNEVRKLQYPSIPSIGDWYLTTVNAVPWSRERLKKIWEETFPEKPWEGKDWFVVYDDKFVGGQKHYQINHTSAIYVSIKKQGHAADVTFGSVDLCLKTFPEKWSELIKAAKDRVDRLNSVDAAIGEGGPTQCAECNKPALEGDYLCGECRGS